MKNTLYVAIYGTVSMLKPLGVKCGDARRSFHEIKAGVVS